MKLRDFNLMIRVLYCIDGYELEGVFDDDDDFIAFRNNPIQYLIQCADEKAGKIWAAARKRFDPQMYGIANAIRELEP